MFMMTLSEYLNVMHVIVISTDDYHQSGFAQIVVFNAVQQNWF